MMTKNYLQVMEAEDKLDNTDFIMKPKIDIAFKMLFGDSKNTKKLIALLSSILKLPKDDLVGLQLQNTEINRSYEDDKKGVLDLLIKLSNGHSVNIEIQISVTKVMLERTLFYWSKLYTNQLSKGQDHRELQKCISISILDFQWNKLKKLHTIGHLADDETHEILTDKLEIHLLELPSIEKDRDNHEKIASDALLQWMMFLHAEDRSEMEMISKYNEDIYEAYEELEIMSKDKNARAIYEARQKEIRDILTRENEAKDEGLAEGMIKGIAVGKIEGKAEAELRIAQKLREQGHSDEMIKLTTGIDLEALK